ncbi:hypothetical protein AX016_1204 [Cellulophaga sp. RHA19]|uniref:hypothetical protein n=1 Tax=Cellulophaga sp. RHA19 TaxID=1798237 RepID=UPI000C2CE2E4|nr:hypothetical protein [Cellulophaga sp. RHA19]PKB43024.1 hypothetical protein AX016_1204 [Cellulophaga sp. RHA19]
MAENLELFTPANLVSVKDCDFENDFVAISCEINEDGFCKHSGLIISFDTDIYYFHFTGIEVKLENITENIESLESIYVKNLDIIVEDDVVSFLGHCEKLKNKGVKPSYGFVFNDSYYDSNTKQSFLLNAKHDITTCVGFCIKVIRGFIFNNEEYLKLKDWNQNSLESVEEWLFDYINKYLKIYADENDLSVEDLYSTNELKRILPSELLSSTYFLELPIAKVSIDSIRPNLESFFISLKVA